jgi:hypothetical protein
MDILILPDGYGILLMKKMTLIYIANVNTRLVIVAQTDICKLRNGYGIFMMKK